MRYRLLVTVICHKLKSADNFPKAKEIITRQVKRDKAVEVDLLDAIDHHVVLRALSHFM